MTRIRISFILTILTGFFASFVIATCGGGDDSSDSSGTIDEKKAIELCEDMTEVYCEKAFECNPELAAWIYESTDASGCAAEAKQDCTEEDDNGQEETSEDTCTPTQTPTQKQIEDCIAQLDAATCETFESAYDSGACADIEDMDTCDEENDTALDTEITSAGDTDADTDIDIDIDTETNLPTDTASENAQAVIINTEGCVAAVQAVCAVADTCAATLKTVPPLVSNSIESCPATMTDKAATITSSCQAYLEEQVPLLNPVALFLNKATATEVTACAGSTECDLAHLVSLLDGLAGFTTSNDTNDLEALITPLVSGSCPVAK